MGTPFKEMSNKIAIGLTVTVIALVAAGFWFMKTEPPSTAPTPPVSIYDGWKTFNDAKTGISFQYPEKLSTKYIHPVDWPPRVALENGPFTCTAAGSPEARAGKTAKKIINNHEYCVTEVSEGAAGSIYLQYAYAFEKNGKVVIFTFTLQEVQCGNYDDPQKTECEKERASFNIDTVIDQIAESLTWDKNNSF